MIKKLETFFEFQKLRTNWKTEIIAGITTFLAMAYIIVVNPAMLSKTGMDFGSVMMATCLASAITCIIMGLFTNLPVALAPGMGLNAFFTYAVCLGMNIKWQIALAAVFVEGIIFILLTMTRIRQSLIESIPEGFRCAMACGIGMFIAFIGFIDAGIVVKNPATYIGLGDIMSKHSILVFICLFLTSALLIYNIKGAILIGIIVTAIIGVPLGITDIQPVVQKGIVTMPPSMGHTFMQMDLKGVLELKMLSIIFVFLFIDIFDTAGTLAGVGELGGYIKDGKFPKAGRAFAADAIGTSIGAMFGTSTITSYIESLSGMASGGRSGVTAIITGLMFVLAIFFAPVIEMIGTYYIPKGSDLTLLPITASALILVGVMMMKSIKKVDWDDYTESIPSFLVILLIPVTFSIGTGIAIAFIAFSILKLLSGRPRECSLLIYIFSLLFIIRFIFLPKF